MSLRTDIKKLLVCCWMLCLPVSPLFAVNDSLSVKYDTAAMELREPDQSVQQEVFNDDDWKYITEENKSSSEDGFFERLWNDLLRSLFDQPNDYDPNFKPGRASGPSVNWWSLFFIVVGAGLIVFFIVKATGAGGSSLFKGKSKRKEEIDATVEDVDIHTITYDTEIAKALSRQDYRFAVRLWFLRSLKEMADLQLINWKIDKTNSDYYYELSGSKLQKEFGTVSRLYDYVWYGEFPMNELRYREAEAELKKYHTNVLATEAKK